MPLLLPITGFIWLSTLLDLVDKPRHFLKLALTSHFHECQRILWHFFRLLSHITIITEDEVFKYLFGRAQSLCYSATMFSLHLPL